MIQKILIGFDFSEPSRRALEVAHELVERMGVAAVLVHVVPDKSADLPEVDEGEPMASIPIDRDRHMEVIAEGLEKEAAKVFRDHADAVQIEVYRGIPSRVMISAARQLGAQMILVGCQGKGMVRSALLGSVSHELLEQAEGLVLTVR